MATATNQPVRNETPYGKWLLKENAHCPGSQGVSATDRQTDRRRSRGLHIFFGARDTRCNEPGRLFACYAISSRRRRICSAERVTRGRRIHCILRFASSVVERRGRTLREGVKETELPFIQTAARSRSVRNMDRVRGDDFTVRAIWSAVRPPRYVCM